MPSAIASAYLSAVSASADRPDAPGPRQTPPPRPLGQNRDFGVYWAGQALSALGDGFAAVATPLLVLEATGSVTQMGAVTAVLTAGRLVAALGAGALVDRVDRRRLMIGTDLGRAVLWATIPLVWWFSGPSMPLLFAVSLVAALLGNVFYVACFTAIPALVRPEEVLSANSRLHGTYAFMGLVGPLVSGLVCSRYGAVTGIFVDALSFVLSAASLAFIRLRAPAPAPPAASDAGLAGHLAGFRFLARTPILALIAGTLAFSAFLNAAQADLVIYHLRTDLQAGAEGVGVVLGVAGLGAIAASLLAPRLHRRAGFPRTWLLGGLLAGLPLSAMALVGRVGGATTPVLLGGLLLVAALGDTLRGILSQSLRHRLTPSPILGRVTAAFWALVDVPAVFGAGAMTALGASLGALPVLTLAGVITTLVGLASTFAASRLPVTPAAESEGAAAGGPSPG